MCYMQAAENYDWRLSIVDLERRDNYFTVLQNRVELLHSTNSEKVRISKSHANYLEDTSEASDRHQGCHVGRLQDERVLRHLGTEKSINLGRSSQEFFSACYRCSFNVFVDLGLATITL